MRRYITWISKLEDNEVKFKKSFINSKELMYIYIPLIDKDDFTEISRLDISKSNIPMNKTSIKNIINSELLKLLMVDSNTIHIAKTNFFPIMKYDIKCDSYFITDIMGRGYIRIKTNHLINIDDSTNVSDMRDEVYNKFIDMLSLNISVPSLGSTNLKNIGENEEVVLEVCINKFKDK